MSLILAVDDEANVLGTIGRVLEDAGHQVIMASSGSDAVQVLKDKQPDIMILDIIMAEMTGIELCKRIRSNPFYARLPIIFLTAKSRPEDIKLGLEAGGDDYITKPFQVIELPARVAALLRRAPGGVLNRESEFLTVGSLHLHRNKLRLHIDNTVYELTMIQYRILYHLMIHAGQPQTVEQLLDSVWEYPPGTGDPALVYAHIKNLRKQIEPQPNTPIFLCTVRGLGYIIYP